MQDKLFEKEIDKTEIEELKKTLNELNRIKDSKVKNPAIKAKIISYFEHYSMYFDERTKCNEIGNIPFDVKDDISHNNSHRNFQDSDFKNMAWSTFRQDDFDGDIFWIDYDLKKGIYVFELPQNELIFSDFQKTLITDLRNQGYNPRRNYGLKRLERGRLGHRQRYPQVDIVLDMTNDAFTEMLGGTQPNFKDYLKAKLDFGKCKLFYKKEASPEEYEARREELLKGLNAEQQEVVETKKKASLVVAGAGCGKTHTLIGRVLHLYNEGKIESPDDLLLVVFNRKNRRDFQRKLRYYGLPQFKAHTFHSLGCSIIGATGENVNTFDPDDGEPLDALLRLFEDKLLNSFQNNFDNKYSEKVKIRCKKYAPEVIKIIENSNWKYNLFKWTANRLPDLSQDTTNEERLMKLYEDLIPNEEQRSLIAQLDKAKTSLDTINYKYDDDDESKVRVLNYLLLSGYQNNDIIIPKDRNYIQIKSLDYKKIYWNDYNCQRSFNEMIKDVPLKRQLTEEEIEKLTQQAVIRTRMFDFRNVAKQFISLCKIYHEEDLDKLEEETKNNYPKSSMHIKGFYTLIKPVLDMYNKFLENDLDFNDMINQAVEKLEDKRLREKFKYKYILVDEFQDVAYDNFLLIKTLKDRNDSSIMCVGDDWQAIYSWRGSDLSFFNNFKGKFEFKDDDYQEFKVTTTYRYGKNMINVSDKFIMNKGNLRKKDLQANDNNPNTQLIEWKDNWQNLINDIIKQEGKDISVKVLQRRNDGVRHILHKECDELTNELKQLFNGKDTTEVLTIHKSKGLEADVVILLDLRQDIFPSATETDPVIEGFHLKHNKSIDSEAEERRLFYVAMTRAKKRCYFYKPDGEYWDEIKKNPVILK